MSEAKYIVVSGGVISGIGKGVSAASIALLLKMRGETVVAAKFDPYLNGNASLLSPSQHGEVYLCDDGTEADLDLGHYERIAGIEVSARNIYTSGKLQEEMREEEVQGKYLGQTVQTCPHFTNKIIEKLLQLGKDGGIVVAEIGGTVGDVESWAFFEAVRQLRMRLGESKVCLVHVAPILWVNTIQEWKTKPLQNSVRELLRHGLTPDVLLCRPLNGHEDHGVPPKLLDKVSLMTGVVREAVFWAPDVRTVYEIPLTFYDVHVDDLVADRFHLKRNGVKIHRWRELVETALDKNLPVVRVGVVAKYATHDAYLSLNEAILHAAVANGCRADVCYIEAEEVEAVARDRGADGVNALLQGHDAVIVPGGFDVRGIEGKIAAAGWCREKRVPFLGICLGLQCAVIEAARNACGIKDANSEEFAAGKKITPVVHEVPIDRPGGRMAGTLRLGSFDANLAPNSLAMRLYRRKTVSERHRHRYEVNADHLAVLAEKGFVASGVNPKSGLIEYMEIQGHPFFLGCQAHPEFQSRLGTPNPCFKGLLAAAKDARHGSPPAELDNPEAENATRGA